MGTAATLAALRRRHAALQAAADQLARSRSMSQPKGHALRILEAARLLPQPFTVAQLVVAAWRRDRRSFGLPGLERCHPSSKLVECYLYGRRGLIDRGHLAWVDRDKGLLRVAGCGVTGRRPPLH